MTKTLTRSRSNRVLTGVCGGIAEYFNIDPTIVRLAAVLLTVGGFGSGLLVYIIATFIMPED